MKILLVGEFSRLHNSLKEGLEALGHEAVIAGTGDGFKNYTIDFSVHPYLMRSSWLLVKIKNAVHKFTSVDLEQTEKGIRFFFLINKFKGFDHVQLINSDALQTHPQLSLKLYKKLALQNSKISLLVCGDETPVIDYSLKGGLKYSVLTPYLQNKSLKSLYSYSLKYTSPPYRAVFNWIKDHASVLITSDLDYELPLKYMGYKTTFIPNPINTDRILYTPPKVSDKVVIFLGINRLSRVKKGIIYFEEALEIISQKYAGKVDIIITENIPYTEYIKSYDRAHILLDQVYSYDQGYNALEAMAKGKVVFTGAETEFMAHFGLQERVAVNALPETEAIVSELSFFIENPHEIAAMGKRARAFIEKEHNYITVAQKYVEAWLESVN